MSGTPEEVLIKGSGGRIDLTSGGILGTLIKLAWPVVAAMFVHTAFLITDMIWLGRLGASEMASVISSMFFIWILFSIAEIVTAGLVAIVSRHYGAKEYGKASYAASQAIGYSVMLSIVITVIGYTFAPEFLTFMGTDPDVTAFGVDYLRVRYLGTILLFWYEAGTSIFRATGDTRRPMIISIVAVAGNIILDPCFIFGIGPIPAMGVKGAAIATVVSTLLAVAGLLTYILNGKLTIDLRIKDIVKTNSKLLWQMVRIGLPLSVNGVLFSVVYVFITKITASFGTVAIAALGVGNRCEAISYMICFGFSVAVSTMVGQNLGAKKPDRAEKTVWIALGITGAITAVVSALFLLIPGLITKAFIADATVIEISKDYLMILAISQVFMAAEIVLEGAFSGAGNTLPPMIVGIPGSLIRLPIAYLLCFTLGVGVNGVWWAITLTTIVKGIILVIWFKRGSWKLQEIE